MTKCIDSRMRTLLLAHAAGSFCAYYPLLFEQSWYDLRWDWIVIILAPVSTLLYLPVLTVLHLQQYYSFQPQQWDYKFMPLTWVCYAVPFVLVCLICRKKASVWKLAVAPVAMTLFVASLWLHAASVTPIPWHSPPEGKWHSPLEGKPAPDFALTSLAGDTFRMSQERGHVVLINFWGSDCPPCVADLKLVISKLADDASLRDRGLRVWTVDAMDDVDTIRKFVATNHYHFTVISNAAGAMTNLYPTGGIPTTYVIGRDGNVRNVLTDFGPKTDEELRADINAALGGQFP